MRWNYIATTYWRRIICHDTVDTDEMKLNEKKMKLKNQSLENYENPFASSFKANFMTIHA